MTDKQKKILAAAEAVEWLLKPLRLEEQNGFTDKAIRGGVAAWLPQVCVKLLQQAKLPESAVDALLAPLTGYHEAPPAIRREKIIAVMAQWQSLLKPEPPTKPALAPRPDPSAEITSTLTLQQAVQYLKGVGPQRARLLANLGIITVEDLLRHYPRDWQDRRQLTKIAETSNNQMALICGQVKARQSFRVRRGMIITKVMVHDGSGLIAATWFNQPYMKDRFQEGQEVILYGKIEFYRTWQIMNPEFEIMEDAQDNQINTGRIVPIYPLTERISQRVMRSMLYAVLQHLPLDLPDILPVQVQNQYGFPDYAAAVQQIHFPDTFEQLQLARQRLVFEELLLQQIAVARIKQRYQSEPGTALATDGELTRRFQSHLPFTLTDAQQRAVGQIFADLAQARPMHRLLQGDVGSGKTIVAALALLTAVDSGQQAALMAPTEVLATQHFLTLRRLLAGYPIRIELFTANATAAERRGRNAALESGEIHLAVGTHALTQEQVQFKSLGLAVIDEQHRFGVEQRTRLRAKGSQPHVLVMTATPIPRTLAMTWYGDLNVSTLDEMPPGRMPIKTAWLARSQSQQAYAKIQEAVAAGQQAYVIFPLIEESEKLDLKALTTEYQRLAKHVFPTQRMGLLHGRLAAEEKEAIMAEFKANTIQILASTTVIEVGIDVPNATVMVIEDADRFGLAALHQLRGRVGRGRLLSHCYLIADPKTEDGRQRMKVMTEVSNGFDLAEKDLAMRGPGEYLGVRQHGLPDLKLADLIRDVKVIAEARHMAQQIMDQDPELQDEKNHDLNQVFNRIYGDKTDRALSG